MTITTGSVPKALVGGANIIPDAQPKPTKAPTSKVRKKPIGAFPFEALAHKSGLTKKAY